MIFTLILEWHKYFDEDEWYNARSMKDEHTYKNFNKETDWIGVDFDGTVHRRPMDKPFSELGEPIPAMLERIKYWLSAGMKVKLLTARVSDTPARNIAPEDIPAFIAEQRSILSSWCKQHIGQELEITSSKDAFMYQIYDDRAVTVERNTGRILGINPEW